MASLPFTLNRLDLFWAVVPPCPFTPMQISSEPGSICCLGSVLNKSPQSHLTLCDPMDCSPPGSSVCGILQARILGWVAMPSSRGSSPTQGWNLHLMVL